MLVSLIEVLKNDGKVLQTDVIPEMKFFTSKLGKFPVVSSTPVSLRIQNRGNKELRIEGDTVIVLNIPCDRCLEDVAVSFPLHFEKDVDMNKSEEERVRALDEQFYIEGYNLDVDKLVCSEILVSWPSKVVCKEDCKGICPTCGTNLNLETCDCEPTDLDPRMAKIQEIFNKFKEV